MTTSSPHPLTTVFTPPASCVTDINWYTYTQSQLNGLVTIGNTAECVDYLCYAGYPSNTNCFPEGWALSRPFSPGGCPDSYTIACSSLRRSGTAMETVATCCPKNFECINTVYSSWPWQSSASCTSIFTEAFILTYTAALSDGGLGLSTIQVYSGWGVNANSVQVRWQSTDTAVLALLTPSYTGTFSDVTTITTTTGFPLPNSPSGNSSGGLSVGAKIGIGVAVPIAVIAILVGVFIIWWRNRKRDSARALASNPELPMQGYPTKPELDSRTVPNVLPQAPPGTQFQGTTPELDHNSSAYIPFRSPTVPLYTENVQEIGVEKKDHNDFGGMKRELDEIKAERERINRKMVQGGSGTEVGEMEC